MGSSRVRDTAYDLAIVLLCGISLIILGQYRLIDRDEGFYLLAAREVISGKVLYLDFFYPQMPLFPYLYGAWMKVCGTTWESARVFTAICAWGLATMVFCYVRNHWNRAAGAVALILFVISNFIFPWYLVAKTYALSTLFLFAACMLALEGSRLTPFVKWILVGALFSFSVQVRLFFAGLLPVFIAYILLKPDEREARFRHLFFFLLGGAFSALPTIILLVRDYESFFYNNLGYHLFRSTRDDEEMSEHRDRLLAILFGFKNPIRDRGINLPTMLYLALGSIIFSLRRHTIPHFFVWIIGALFILNFLPTPPYIQYFSTLAPFLVVTALFFIRDLMIATSGRRILQPLLVLLLSVVAIRYVSIFPGEVTRHTVTGDKILGVGNEKRAVWFTQVAMDEIATYINARSQPGDFAITMWPGYLLESHLQVYPRFENHFGFPASLRVTRDSIKHFHLPSIPYLLRSIQSGIAKIVLTIPGSESPHVRGALIKGGYHFDGSLYGVRVWVRG